MDYFINYLVSNVVVVREKHKEQIYKAEIDVYIVLDNYFEIKKGGHLLLILVTCSTVQMSIKKVIHSSPISLNEYKKF